MIQPYTMVVYHKVKVTKLYDTKIIQYEGYTIGLYNEVIQLSSYHLTNKEVHYVHTADNQDNLLPRGGPIQNPYPLSWK